MGMSFGGVSKQKVATVIVAADGSGDTTDIQTGINLLPATGGVVYIREGTYTLVFAVNTIIIESDNISLIGAGKSTIITTTGSFSMLPIISANNIQIKNLAFVGNGVGASQRGVSIIGNSTKVSIIDCWFNNIGANGIRIAGSTDCIVDNSHINTIGRWGIQLQTGAGASDPILNTKITNCDITTTGRGGIEITASGATDPINHTTIANNVIINADSGNTATYSGIDIVTADSGSVDYTIIEGNNIRDCDNYGINLQDAGVAKTLITSNSISNNTTGAVNDVGTDTHPNGASGTNNLALDDLNIIA